MIFKMEELIEMIKDYSEKMGLEKPNESVLEEIESQYGFDPYNNCIIYRVTEGFLIIPLAFPEDGDAVLLTEEAYGMSATEIQNVLTRMRSGYEELLVMQEGSRLVL